FFYDDTSDIFWYNATTGDTQIWLLGTPDAPALQTFPLLRVKDLTWKPVSAP
ncbi:MAG: hypothetical protein QOH21_1395, partial [Acidobacteriota bacterium]|nr:hypothetical protein [Acidobacteriota bacterium]